MKPFDPADHPRGDGGRFKAKTHAEPEGSLEADTLASIPSKSLQGIVTWRRPDGVLHRTDGPAVTWPSGRLEWWENGVRRPPEVEEVLTMLWNARTP